MQRDKSLHSFQGLCSHARGVLKALLTPFASASDRDEQGVIVYLESVTLCLLPVSVMSGGPQKFLYTLTGGK